MTAEPLVPADWMAGQWPHGQLVDAAPPVVAKLAAAATLVETWLREDHSTPAALAVAAGVDEGDVLALLDGASVPSLHTLAALEQAVGRSLW